MIETIKEQLAIVFDGDPWYGSSITTVLESVDPGRVFDLPGNGMHSIAELVAHMITWREFTERRLREDGDYLPEQEQSFDWQRFSGEKKRVWKIMIERLNANQQNLLTLLDQHDDTLLARTVAGKPYTFHYLLTGLLQHDLYHLGQIVYIQKLLGRKQEKFFQGNIPRYNSRIFSFEHMAQQK